MGATNFKTTLLPLLTSFTRRHTIDVFNASGSLLLDSFAPNCRSKVPPHFLLTDITAEGLTRTFDCADHDRVVEGLERLRNRPEIDGIYCVKPRE